MTVIKLRRDTADNWTSINPILASGEPGYEIDTDQLKIGNGSLPWTGLDYFGGVGGDGTTDPEIVRDTVAAMFASGTHTGITFEFSDANDSVSATVDGGGTGGTGFTVEQAQDAAASLFTSAAHTGITFTYDDVNNKLVANVPANMGPTGAAGATGATGSGVGPTLLGETVMTTSSSSLTGTTSQDWSGFSKTVTVGSKPIYVKLDCHVQVSAAASLVLGILDGATVVQAWNIQVPSSGVSHHFYGETAVLNPSSGSHTYKVQLRATAAGPSYTGIADANFKASMKVMEL